MAWFVIRQKLKWPISRYLPSSYGGWAATSHGSRLRFCLFPPPTVGVRFPIYVELCWDGIWVKSVYSNVVDKFPCHIINIYLVAIVFKNEWNARRAFRWSESLPVYLNLFVFLVRLLSFVCSSPGTEFWGAYGMVRRLPVSPYVRPQILSTSSLKLRIRF